MKIVIMGCSRTGAELAVMLTAEGHDVTVIDRDAYSFRRLPDSYRGRSMLGNGIDQQALKKAGIEQADAFFAVTQGDNRNVMASQIAKHVFGVGRVICRIYDPLRADIFTELGLATFNPTRLGASALKGILESVEA